MSSFKKSSGKADGLFELNKHKSPQAFRALSTKFKYKPESKQFSNYGMGGLFGCTDLSNSKTRTARRPRMTDSDFNSRNFVKREEKYNKKLKNTVEGFSPNPSLQSISGSNTNTGISAGHSPPKGGSPAKKMFQRNGDFSLPSSYSNGRDNYVPQTAGFGTKDFRLTDNKFYPPSLAVTLDNIQRFPFLTYQDHRKDYWSRASEATYGQKEVTELSDRFFSRKNIQLIQKLLKRAVFIKTNRKIKLQGDFDENDLLVVMMATYHEYGRDLPKHIGKQVFELDSIVVQTTLPGVLTNLKQYVGYIRDITLPRVILDQPLATNTAGRRTLPSITTIF